MPVAISHHDVPEYVYYLMVKSTNSSVAKELRTPDAHIKNDNILLWFVEQCSRHICQQNIERTMQPYTQHTTNSAYG